jgi:hypothetical protein
MSTINDGGPAFPRHGYNSNDGMTLRDWFAGQAMAGLASYVTKGATFDDIAKDAYAIADAMLAAREVKP